jgi:hypothetical protein
MKFSASRKKREKSRFEGRQTAISEAFLKKLTKCRPGRAGIFFDFQGRSNEKY